MGECGGMYIRGREDCSVGIFVFANVLEKGRRKVRIPWSARSVPANAC